MAYAFTPRRAMAFLMISTMLAGCTADGLVPPGSIDSGTRVGAIQPRQPSAAMTMPAGPGNQGYGAPQPVVQAQSLGTLDGAPSGQGNLQQPMPPASAAGTRLPMIDSDAAMNLQSARVMGAPPSALGTLTYDSNGVNMDAGLGVSAAEAAEDARVVGLAEEQDGDIAEGNASQPVVDGIGTDNPVARAPRQEASLQPMRAPAASTMTDADRVVVPPKRSPQPQRSDLSAAPRWGDQSPVTQPSRPKPAPQEVAMLMPDNPAEMRQSPRLDAPPGGPMPTSEIACRRELKRMGVEFVDKPRISDGPSCGIDYPVSLSGLSGNIDVKPAVTLNCQTTLAFAKWVKSELAPSARLRYLTGIGSIQPMGGYSCRRMNNSRQKYNPMSEHARGNAIDIGRFTLKNGHDIDIRKKGFFSFREAGLLKAVRSDSCKYFNTVLGPGSNKEHWNHFHFDLRSRGNGNRYCN
jgi:hypothetical protein